MANAPAATAHAREQIEGGYPMRNHTSFITVAAATLAVFAATNTSVAETGDAKQAEITRAMQAAPDSITKNATFIDADGTVLRSGSNGWTCSPTSGPGSTHPMCSDEVWMNLMTALSNKADFKTDRIGISYMLAGDDNVNNADPFDTKQDQGEVWVQEGPHLMIIVPDTKMLEGISDNPDNGGPYVMWKGTPYVHMMVPVGPRQAEK
jgi:hypothetical protein